MNDFPEHIVFFDDECVLCNWFAQFIIDRDNKKIFYFSSLNSETAKKIIPEKIIENFDTVVLRSGKNLFYSSTAALKILKLLGGFWKSFYVFIIIPVPIRDLIYKFIAKNRTRWFGKSESCPIISNHSERIIS